MRRPARRAQVFFYGMFMDRTLLEAKGLAPLDVELASVPGYALRVGQRATLVPESTARVHGVVMSLGLSELERLYAEPDLRAYEPHAVLVDLVGGGRRGAMCWIVAESAAGARDEEYVVRLLEIGRKVGLPEDYLAALARGSR